MVIRQKYPRTLHVPWSPGATKDDKFQGSMDNFVLNRVIVTEKYDGENTTLYKDHIHARSISSADHPSRSWVKSLWGTIKQDIPDGWRICGENLFAMHSIFYDDLKSYFLVFNIWDENNYCLDWDSTKEWCELLGIEHVSVLYDGIYDEHMIKNSWSKQINGRESEGYVIRNHFSFSYDEFYKNVAKYVRKNHVKTSSHWMSQEIIPNKLKNQVT